MLEALKTRNPVAVKRLMDRHIPFFSFFPAPKNSDFYKELPERYIYAWSCIFPNSTEDDIQVNLERISQLIATTKPRIVNSIHNDFTAHTIRGTVKPGDDWEIHYSILKSGRIVIQRICEFNNTPKFRWGREWNSNNKSKTYADKKHTSNLDFQILKAAKNHDIKTFRNCFNTIHLSALASVDDDSELNLPVSGFTPEQRGILSWDLLSMGTITHKTNIRDMWRMLDSFSNRFVFRHSRMNSPLDGGIDYMSTSLPSKNSFLIQYCGAGHWQNYVTQSRPGHLPLLKKIEYADANRDFGSNWFNFAPL